MADNLSFSRGEMDFYSSFESTSEVDLERSLPLSPTFPSAVNNSPSISTPDTGTGAAATISHSGVSALLSDCSLSDIPNFDSSQDQSFENSNGLMFDNRKALSADKIRELKEVMSEVSEAFTESKMLDFVMNSVKESLKLVPSQLRAKVEQVLTADSALQSAYIKSKDGSKYNILGLEDEDIESLNISLSDLEKKELSKHAMPVLKNNLEQLCSQRRELQKEFGRYALKVWNPDTLLSQEMEELVNLYQQVQKQPAEASQLLIANNEMMQEEARLQTTVTRDQLTTCHKSLKERVNYLQALITKMDLTTELMMNKDKNYTLAMDILWDRLKASVGSLREELKGLQKRLVEYQEVEKANPKYQQIVEEYMKLKKELEHKKQTLSLLKDPDVSFS